MKVNSTRVLRVVNLNLTSKPHFKSFSCPPLLINSNISIFQRKKNGKKIFFLTVGKCIFLSQTKLHYPSKSQSSTTKLKNRRGHPTYILRLSESEECEYTMILQTIMLTNVLIYNDSYVCSSILYVRTHPSDNDSDLQLHLNSDWLFAQLLFLQSMVLHNICIWYKVYTYPFSIYQCVA